MVQKGSLQWGGLAQEVLAWEMAPSCLSSTAGCLAEEMRGVFMSEDERLILLSVDCPSPGALVSSHLNVPSPLPPI